MYEWGMSTRENESGLRVRAEKGREDRRISEAKVVYLSTGHDRGKAHPVRLNPPSEDRRSFSFHMPLARTRLGS